MRISDWSSDVCSSDLLRQPLAGHDARVADARNPAAARQLGEGPAGRLPLGLRLQRARCGRGLHPAEPATGCAAGPSGDHPDTSGGRAMIAVLVFLAGVAAIAGYWLVRPGLMSKRSEARLVGKEGGRTGR